jgi:alpha-L-arabinofuranosidase
MTISNTQDAVRNRVAYSIVRDTKTNDVIVKLVNLLPVTVTSTLDLEGIVIADTQAIKTVMQGDPGDKTIKPVSSAFTVSNKFTEQLSPYSFTIIRIKTK